MIEKSWCKSPWFLEATRREINSNLQYDEVGTVVSTRTEDILSQFKARDWEFGCPNYKADYPNYNIFIEEGSILIWGLNFLKFSKFEAQNKCF